MLNLLPRHQIDPDAWDACVVASTQRIVYGYSWYLDTVLPKPDWKWMGLVLIDETGHYRAVMPIPLRRKQVLSLPYEWVVHQPFFCQFLAVFSPDLKLNSDPFFETMQRSFRYGSMLAISQRPLGLAFDRVWQQTTHTLDLSVGYDVIYRNYTHDRQTNLRRAIRANWTIIDSDDPEPLLNLFCNYHAETIRGGVAKWAYAILRNLIEELNQRGLVLLRYAVRHERIEAGALFVQSDNRIIYLFNAASETGRRHNARTLLIDQVIQEYAGHSYAGRRYAEKPVVFDFESPEKPSIQGFYRSFGAVEEPFWAVHWSRLTIAERLIQRLINQLSG